MDSLFSFSDVVAAIVGSVGFLAQIVSNAPTWVLLTFVAAVVFRLGWPALFTEDTKQDRRRRRRRNSRRDWWDE